MKHLILLCLLFVCSQVVVAQELLSDPLSGVWNKRTLLYCEGENWSIRIPAKAIKDKGTKDLVKPIGINDVNYTLRMKKGVINIKDKNGYNILITSADRSFVYVDDVRYNKKKKRSGNYIAYEDEAGEIVLEAFLDTFYRDASISILNEENPHLDYLLALAFEEMIRRVKTVKALDTTLLVLESL